MGINLISSTKALLMLYVNGKTLLEDDLNESILSLEAILDQNTLIDELYLLSIYNFLTPLKDKKLLLEAFLKVDEQSFDTLELSSAIVYAKLLLAKTLSAIEIKDHSFFSSFGKIEYLSDPLELSSLGSFLLFAGIFSDNKEICEKGCAIAEILIRVINSDGEVDTLFLIGKGLYKKDSCRASLFILMSLYDAVTKNSEIFSILKKLDPYEGGLFQSLDVEIKLSCKLLEMALPKCNFFEKRLAGLNKPEGLLTIESSKFKYRSSVKKKDGLGSISHLGALAVPSFGPHILPLGKSDLYGMNDLVCDEGALVDNAISMWNRVKSKEIYGDHWLHSKVSLIDNFLRIESFIWSEKKEENVSLVFFIRAESIEIDDRKYQSRGLERVRAKTTKLTLNIKGKKLEIHSKDLIEIEIIPLAGQQFFWNSDFIISFPYHKGKVLSLDWVIEE